MYHPMPSTTVYLLHYMGVVAKEVLEVRLRSLKARLTIGVRQSVEVHEKHR
jgi:hypothetical protein